MDNCWESVPPNDGPLFRLDLEGPSLRSYSRSVHGDLVFGLLSRRSVDSSDGKEVIRVVTFELQHVVAARWEYRDLSMKSHSPALALA
jgi:hypothetical protein